MRRLTLATALVALLAFPALALAHGGDKGGNGNGKHGKHGADVARLSAQAGCRAERQQLGNGDFDDRYGTNRNKANAFGKCVSGGVKAGSGNSRFDEIKRRLREAAQLSEEPA